jgi:hypothetical protein
MRTVQVSKANDPLEIVERDIPEPSASQVRIKPLVFVTKPYPSQGLIYSIKYMVLKEEISWKIE